MTPDKQTEGGAHANPRNLPWEIFPGSRTHKASLRDCDRGIISFIDEFCEPDDRAFIVTACNSHADMLAALEAAQNQVITLFCEEFAKTLSPDRCASVKTTLDVIKAAIARAEGRA